MRDRYDTYADIFDNPVTDASLELGNRVLHWMFMENFAAYVAYGAIRQHAEQAIELAQQGPTRRHPH